MINGYKLYLTDTKYKILDDTKLIDLAKRQMMYKDSVRKKYSRKIINKVDALTICELINIKIKPVDVMLIKTTERDSPVLKSIECMEKDIQDFIFDYAKEKKEEDVKEFIIKDLKAYTRRFQPYFSGSRNAMLSLLKDDLHYKATAENDNTLDYFIDSEVYVASNISYQSNIITVEITKDKFTCDFDTEEIYKYNATIINEDSYQYNFKKGQLFISREAATLEAKKLVDEHYNLPITNSKIQRICVRTHDGETIIVFWTAIKTKDGTIIANDVIGTSDLAGETNTSLEFFNKCQPASPEQIQIAKDVIENCMNLKTFNVKGL